MLRSYQPTSKSTYAHHIISTASLYQYHVCRTISTFGSGICLIPPAYLSQCGHESWMRLSGQLVFRIFHILEEEVTPVVNIQWPPVLLLVSRYPAHWLRSDTQLRRMVRRRRKKKGS